MSRDCVVSSVRAVSTRALPATSCASIRLSSTSRASSGCAAKPRKGDTDASARKLREALALWRGPPLADLAYEPSLQLEIARLEEMRLVTLEDRIDADLAVGRHADLVGELEPLVAGHPVRERLRAQLMLALYRSARQSEALDAYRAARRELTQGLGLEPSPRLRQLERAILRQDPELELPVGGRNGAGRGPPREPVKDRGVGGGSRTDTPRGRWVRVVFAAAALALCGAAVIALGGDDGHDASPPIGSGLAMIDPSQARVSAFTELPAAPGNIAIGEGAVWMLNSEDDAITGVDPRSGRLVKSIRTGRRHSDLAAGAGALWVGNGAGRWWNNTTSVSRVDPRSAAITHTEPLPDKTGGRSGQGPSLGFPHIAVGAGAVWVLNPDDTLSRLDPRTGRRVATIEAGVLGRTIAAGAEGVWFLSGWRPGSVLGVDPRTNRVAQTIHVGSDSLAGIAVGAGSIWATSPQDGQLWRIDPRTRLTRTIDVGVGVEFVAFGAGAVWTGNYVDGVVTRVDPRTNRVAARVQVGAVQTLAAGPGGARAGVARGTRDGTLPAPTCSQIASGGRAPDVLIASDLPLQGPVTASTRAQVEAIRLVLAQRGFRAGEHVVGYQSCDDSTAQSGFFEPRKCAANANAYARAPRVVAVIGPSNSQCAQAQVAILNRAPGGPLALVTPGSTAPDLTRGGRLDDRSWGLRGDPDVYYPTGRRNFLRVSPRDDVLGVALALHAQRLGLRRVYVLYDRQNGRKVHVTDPFRRAAARLGVGITGAAAFDGTAESYAALAGRVAGSGADGVVIGGNLNEGGGRLLKALRARVGEQVAIMTGDWFLPISDALELAGGAAHGLYVATGLLPPWDELRPTPAQARVARDLGDVANAEGVAHAALAAEVILQAIARSDGSRASVLRELWATRVTGGALGPFGFDRYGDITPASVAIVRVTGARGSDPRLAPYLRGGRVERVVRVPASLSG